MHYLFLGLNHSIGDPRLCFRQMPVLREARPDLKMSFLASDSKSPIGVTAGDVEDRFDVEIHRPPPDRNLWQGLQDVGRLRRAVSYRWRKAMDRLDRWTWAARKILRLRPDIVQASDARELPLAVALSWLIGYELIYDAHEDYFNQVYEYRGKTWTAFIAAVWLGAKETLFARAADHVFVTSISHREIYLSALYGLRSVEVVPNYAPAALMPPAPSYPRTSALRLVYVGSVNRYRGVVETAEYVRTFNQRDDERSLEFHYIGNGHDIVDDLVRRDLVVDHGPLAYPDLLPALRAYDIGICLLHDIKKFHTSVPVKNFDYMAAGLPVLTSSFGEMQRYVRRAGAGYCIEPTSYEAFEAAILDLFNPRRRRMLGTNGRAFSRGAGSFENAAQPYIDCLPGARAS